MNGSWLDQPLDPNGDAYVSLAQSPENAHTYAIICRGRTFYTNTKKRFKKHYRLASRRSLAGTWFIYDDQPMFAAPHYRWWRIRLSENAL